jgi:hypothetical protein
MVDPPTLSVDIAQIQDAETDASGFSSIVLPNVLLCWQGDSISIASIVSIYCDLGGRLQNSLFLYLGKYDMDEDK